MPSRKKASKNDIEISKASFLPPQEQDCYEGERLACLLKSMHREIESARLLDGNSLPEKIWLKQQFSIGVNDVTRVLERMAPSAQVGSSPQRPSSIMNNCKAPLVQLQAVLLASDCNPRWLTKHLPSLASSRRVPLIFVKDMKGGSLRLGELVKLKTAIAIGVKAKGNAINQIFEKILQGDEVRQTDRHNSTNMKIEAMAERELQPILDGCVARYCNAEMIELASPSKITPCIPFPEQTPLFSLLRRSQLLPNQILLGS